MDAVMISQQWNAGVAIFEPGCGVCALCRIFQRAKLGKGLCLLPFDAKRSKFSSRYFLNDSSTVGAGKRLVCPSNMTALLGGAALFIPSYECNSPIAPSNFDRLISGYRLIGGPLLYRRVLRLGAVPLFGHFFLTDADGAPQQQTLYPISLECH